MKVVLDSNIVFSSLIKPDGKISEIILNPFFQFEKFSCYFLYIEIFKHKDRIVKMSTLDEPELLEIFYQIIRRIEFVNEERIPKDVFRDALELTKEIDSKDTTFVALSMYFDAYLWTGDKVLQNGLKKKAITGFCQRMNYFENLK
jgi:predicted nucleic acid-binding protein